MSMLATIRRFARYKLWADQLIFAAVAALPEEEALKPRASVFRNMVHTLNHVTVIDRIFQAGNFRIGPYIAFGDVMHWPS